MTTTPRPAVRRRTRSAAVVALIVTLFTLVACSGGGRVDVNPSGCFTPPDNNPSYCPSQTPVATATATATSTDTASPSLGGTASPLPSGTPSPLPSGTFSPTATGTPAGPNACAPIRQTDYEVGPTTIYAASDPAGLAQLRDLRGSDATFVAYLGPFAPEPAMKQWMTTAACSGLNLRIQIDRAFKELSIDDAKSYVKALDADVAAINATRTAGATGTVTLTYLVSQNGGAGSIDQLNDWVSAVQSTSSTLVSTWIDYNHHNNQAGVDAANQFKGQKVIAYLPCCGSSKYGTPAEFPQAASFAVKVQPGHPAMAVQAFSWPDVDPAFTKQMGFDATQPSATQVGSDTATAKQAGAKDITVYTLDKTAENTPLMKDMVGAAAKELKP
jgi:hypothetical protein